METERKNINIVIKYWVMYLLSIVFIYRFPWPILNVKVKVMHIQNAYI